MALATPVVAALLIAAATICPHPGEEIAVAVPLSGAAAAVEEEEEEDMTTGWYYVNRYLILQF